MFALQPREGNWPWVPPDEGGGGDPRFRFSLTSLSHPSRRCIGFARRRVGRGGRWVISPSCVCTFTGLIVHTVVIYNPLYIYSTLGYATIILSRDSSLGWKGCPTVKTMPDLTTPYGYLPSIENISILMNHLM